MRCSLGLTHEASKTNTLSLITRGVTVHKIHGSVRYDTVVSRFGMFSIRGAGQLLRSNVGNISVLNHEGEPMDIKQARVYTRVCTRARFMPVNVLIAVDSL